MILHMARPPRLKLMQTSSMRILTILKCIEADFVEASHSSVDLLVLDCLGSFDWLVFLQLLNLLLENFDLRFVSIVGLLLLLKLLDFGLQCLDLRCAAVTVFLGRLLNSIKADGEVAEFVGHLLLDDVLDRADHVAAWLASAFGLLVILRFRTLRLLRQTGLNFG